MDILWGDWACLPKTCIPITIILVYLWMDLSYINKLNPVFAFRILGLIIILACTYMVIMLSVCRGRRHKQYYFQAVTICSLSFVSLTFPSSEYFPRTFSAIAGSFFIVDDNCGRLVGFSAL